MLGAEQKNDDLQAAITDHTVLIRVSGRNSLSVKWLHNAPSRPWSLTLKNVSAWTARSWESLPVLLAD